MRGMPGGYGVKAVRWVCSDSCEGDQVGMW